MLFLTYDPYNDDTNNRQSKIYQDNEECFICYEIKINNEKAPIKLNTQVYYFKNCNCEGLVHKECLDKWYNSHQKCPICRSIITKNDFIIICLFKYNLYLYIFYTFCRKNILKLKNLFFVFLFLYFFTEYYISLLNSKIYYHNYLSDISLNYNQNTAITHHFVIFNDTII